jgi:hypothetical protein
METERTKDIMRECLREALANGYTRDANDLSVYATASGVFENLSKLRVIAAGILNDAGYCECGVKFNGSDRCGCGRSTKR